jgi:hypothetical protein
MPKILLALIAKKGSFNRLVIDFAASTKPRSRQTVLLVREKSLSEEERNAHNENPSKVNPAVRGKRNSAVDK